MRRKNWELKGIFWIITLLFVGFLAAPILLLLGKSLVGEGGFTWEFYASVVTREGFLTALGNSFAVAAASAVTATVIAFLMAYAVHYTGLPRWAKRLITAIATLPMFLPTITYGFAIIYSFGKQGLLTRLLGRQFFDIYGFGGLLVGYVIYTIPVAFLLIHNTMGFVDQKGHHCLQGHGGPGPGHLLDRHSSPPAGNSGGRLHSGLLPVLHRLRHPRLGGRRL